MIKSTVLIRQSNLEKGRCLFRLHEDQVLALPHEESEFSIRGTHFHALAKMYVDYLVRSQQESDWEYADELVESGSWSDEGALIFKQWARENAINYESVYATEMKIRLDENMMPCEQQDAMYSGDLDRLDIHGSNAVIIDYKSHFLASDPTSIQSIFYPWLLLKIMPHLETVTFRLQFVRWNISRERVIDRDDVARMDRFVANHVARILTAEQLNEWPATVNSGCVYCRHACPLVDAGLSQEAIGQVQTAEHAAEMAQQLYALHLAAKRLHGHLKNWATRTGTIDAGNDIRLGFRKVLKKDADPRIVASLNVDHGFAPTRALKVDSKEVKKIGKQYKEYADTVWASAKDKSTTAFKFWNEVGDPLDMEEEE